MVGQQQWEGFEIGRGKEEGGQETDEENDEGGASKKEKRQLIWRHRKGWRRIKWNCCLPGKRRSTVGNCAARIVRLFLIEGRLCLLVALLAIPLFLLLIWLSGLADILHETPFSEFKWPPFMDVRKQVILELLGQPVESPPINLWDTFQPLISPDCKQQQHTHNQRKRSILAIVKSAPERNERRNAIRETYGRADNLVGNFQFHAVFAMGQPIGGMDALEKEASTFGDLLVGNFVDHYFNNTLKFVHSIAFAHNNCGAGTAVPYLALLDDDYLMLPWNLAVEAAKHVPNERLYMGWRYDSTPFRFRLSKYSVSLAEYPFNAYPAYITAGAVLLTGQTVSEFHAAIQHTVLFKFDDIYAGILAYLLGIQPQHNPNFPSKSHYRMDQEWWRSLVAAHGYSPQQLRQSYSEAVEKWRRGGNGGGRG